MSPIFSSGEPGPQLTWTAMNRDLIKTSDELRTVWRNRECFDSNRILGCFGYRRDCISKRMSMLALPRVTRQIPRIIRPSDAR